MQPGVVSVIDPKNGHTADFAVPAGPEVTGVCLSSTQDQLYVIAPAAFSLNSPGAGSSQCNEFTWLSVPFPAPAPPLLEAR